MDPILELQIILDESYIVENETCKVAMVLFHGKCTSTFFQGTILPGAVDTQKVTPEKSPMLSARYIIEGADNKKKKTRIFIENNGMVQENGELITHPVIITDNKDLQWLEKANLIGKIVEKNQELLIQFFEE